MDKHIDLPADAAERIARRVPFTFRHTLHDHGLLALDALAELADRLPADDARVERFGDAAFVGPQAAGPRGGTERTAGSFVRAIATNGCWADLRHIERVPTYRALVESLLREALADLPRLRRACVSREGFVFITAPRAVTPPHSDPEHNFYLQLRGRKTFALAPLARLDPGQLTDWRRRRGYEGGYRRPLGSIPSLEPFDLEAGMGLYVPVYAVHEVHNGDAVSVALSVTCRTRGTRSEYVMHALRRQLHRLAQRSRSTASS